MSMSTCNATQSLQLSSLSNYATFDGKSTHLCGFSPFNEPDYMLAALNNCCTTQISNATKLTSYPENYSDAILSRCGVGCLAYCGYSNTSAADPIEAFSGCLEGYLEYEGEVMPDGWQFGCVKLDGVGNGSQTCKASYNPFPPKSGAGKGGVRGLMTGTLLVSWLVWGVVG